MNLFMTPPVIAMQGKIAHMASASRQDRTKATMKPVKKADMKLTTKGTAEMPCCTRSKMIARGRTARSSTGVLTSVCLNPRSDLAGPYCIEELDILAQNSLVT
jgi:hypothetical protein